MAKWFLSYRGSPLEQALLVVIVALALVAIVFVPSSHTTRLAQPVDFTAYYLAARVLNEHAPLYSERAMRVAAESTGAHYSAVYVYPPFVAAALRPLAVLPFHVAVLLWRGASVGFLLIALVLTGQINLVLLVLLAGAVFLVARAESGWCCWRCCSWCCKATGAGSSWLRRRPCC